MDYLLNDLSKLLSSYNNTLENVVLALLQPQTNHILVTGLLSSSICILDTFGRHPGCQGYVRAFVINSSTKIYIGELDKLTSIQTGWHFNTMNTIPEQLDQFSLEEMAGSMRKTVSYLSGLVDQLLTRKLYAGPGNEMQVDRGVG